MRLLRLGTTTLHIFTIARVDMKAEDGSLSHYLVISYQMNDLYVCAVFIGLVFPSDSVNAETLNGGI